MNLKPLIKEAAYLALFCAIAVLALFCFAGCATVGANEPAGSPETDRVHTERNPYAYGTVAKKIGNKWHINHPPELRFTGRTATGRPIQDWARSHGIVAAGVFADTNYAQLESQSAIRLALWTKAVLADIGYDYLSGSRDCEQFAKVARTIPDLFAESAPGDAQAAVFGIFAVLDQPFAGVTDGYHALNVAWTDLGMPVFEPQGRDLVYQDVRAWPNKGGINRFQTE